MTKEKKHFEAKVKEVKDLRQQESQNQSKTIQDRDQAIVRHSIGLLILQKKLRCDLDRAKRERDDVVKLKELSDVRLLSLEQNLLDLNSIVEKCQRDIDKSHLKKDKLAEENTYLQT